VTSRQRNLGIIGLVLLLLAAAAVLIASKPTRLGLDLKGGVELVYEGRPTPQVPQVTPQAIDDAIDTIRKRTDALGVSEPEIQRAGANQISVGLPDVKNADRAETQVGTTAKLQFYDWEPNIFGDPNAPKPNLFDAVKAASKAKPRAEPTDVPPGGPNEQDLRKAGIDPNDKQAVQRYYDRRNDTGTDKYYLFDPKKPPAEQLIGGPDPTCKELLQDYSDRLPANGKAPGERTFAKDTQCAAELSKLGSAGPPAGSTVLKVPRGIVVVEAEKRPGAPETAPKQYFVIEDDSELSGADIKNPEQNFDQRTNEPIVTMEFTGKGRKAFANVTKRIAIRGAETIVPPGAPPDAALQRFAITLDNKIVSLATIDFRENPEGIDGRTGAQINGIGNLQETQDLAQNLRIGALPIDLKLISKTQVSATLGKQALHQGLIAGGVGLALTLLFLLLFYRVLGLVAGLALVTYAVLLFALVKLIPITLTLPGIAGLILTLGVAADANIVIFERIKEEARGGASIPRAITAGYAKALRTIIDANVVTIGVAFILFMLATAGVKGFAFTLGIGTIVSLFTAVLATSAILGSMARSRLLGSRAALGAGRRHRAWRFDFMGASRWFFSMSGVILVAGALAIAGLGINFGIDFESGTRIKTPLEEPASVDQVRSALRPLGFGDAEIQTVDDPELGKNVFQIQTTTLEPDEVTKVRSALDSDFGVRQADFSSQSIGPTFGAQIARTAIIAVIASLILISIYIGLRFEFKFAVPVLIALAHDLLITSGVYALTDREVTTSTVAALLTILGYSLYDTIIVFDRIRENVPRMPRATFSQIVNRSMSEVLTRSLVTSLSTLIPITALMLFGGETLKDFGFALLVGVASGTYSSIFIAAPVLTAWKEREPVWVRRRQLVMQDHDGHVPAYAEAALGAPAERPGEPRRPARPGVRQRRVARQAAPPAAPPPTPAPVPDERVEAVGADVGPGDADGRTPDPAPEPVATREARRPDRSPDGGGPDAADGGAQAPKPPPPKPKPKRTRQRKKHGRR
jgi:SecD/SecF fusion protein